MVLRGSLLDTVGDAIGLLDDLEQKSVPFAAAKTLTVLARDGQVAVRRELPARFTIRRDRVAKGVRIRPATKKKLEAAVFTLDWFMKDQQDGGVRGSKSGRARLIPTVNVRVGGKIKGLVKRGMRPRALLRAAGLQYKLERAALSPSAARVGAIGNVKGARRKKRRGRKPKVFVARLGSGKLGIWIRTTDKRLPVELLYTIRARVDIAPRWAMDKTVSKVATSRFRQEFLENLQSAFETDRRRPGHRRFLDALRRGG